MVKLEAKINAVGKGLYSCSVGNNYFGSLMEEDREGEEASEEGYFDGSLRLNECSASS